ncbi:unnamed protein product [Mytilus coruscus]|uniref:YqaJ viral recombinase domain-containing protein n=1 Tax=Mytilus coruscus TaxID=42192 RepID=A0A6J8E3X3_MYTCO|nr:unnamed protein product [Mytilus coruscus]
MLNHCNRGSWHTRCYATALRFNKGPTWSPNVWEQATKSTPGVYFEKLYEQRKQCINNNNTTKDKCSIKQNRWKRKMSSIKESNTKKAKQHYGKESLQVETDITLEELEKLKKENIHTKVEQSGLVIDKHHKFLGGSPDGIVTENNAKGLIEIKNLVHDKNINLTQASMSVKNFCLEKISNNLKLKTNHNYYFQWQGLLNYTKVPYLGSTSSQQTSGKVKTRRRKPLTVESDTEIDGAVVKTTSKVTKRLKRKCSGPKFVGREILHEWVEENNNRKWYKGRVISVIQNKDGDKDAVYEVLYEDCDEPYEIYHLLEDFTNFSLKLIDL